MNVDIKVKIETEHVELELTQAEARALYEDKWKNGSFCVNIKNGWKYFDVAPRFNLVPHIVGHLLGREE